MHVQVLLDFTTHLIARNTRTFACHFVQQQQAGLAAFQSETFSLRVLSTLLSLISDVRVMLFVFVSYEYCGALSLECSVLSCAQAPSSAPRIGGPPASRPTSAAQARKVCPLHIVASVHWTCLPLSTSALLLHSRARRRAAQTTAEVARPRGVYLMNMHMDIDCALNLTRIGQCFANEPYTSVRVRHVTLVVSVRRHERSAATAVASWLRCAGASHGAGARGRLEEPRRERRALERLAARHCRLRRIARSCRLCFL